MSEELKLVEEIEILNADALDVEELEHRLEMAGSLSDFAMYCVIDICGVDCPTLGCIADGCISNGGGGGGGEPSEPTPLN